MGISVEKLNNIIDNKEVKIYTLCNENNVKVGISNYGGIILSIITPDKNGNLADIALGYENFEDYKTTTCYLGALVGRYANRIAKANIKINDKEYDLAVNDGNNHLHGGIKGFNRVVWNSEILSDNGQEYIHMTYLSVDGEENYPGNLNVTVDYKLTDNNELVIDYYAKSDKDTIVNLTNHSYFNLSGHDSGNILDHKVKIYADYFTPTDSESIPTGEIRSVVETPLDLREFKRVGEEIESSYEQIKFAKGYDHNWVLNNQCGDIVKAAEVVDDKSGRILEVYTTKPGIQFYTGNYLDESEIGKGGVKYQPRQGLCLETQYYPDSLNHKDFPNVILKAGDNYKHTTIYKFLNK